MPAGTPAIATDQLSPARRFLLLVGSGCPPPILVLVQASNARRRQITLLNCGIHATEDGYDLRDRRQPGVPTPARVDAEQAAGCGDEESAERAGSEPGEQEQRDPMTPKQQQHSDDRAGEDVDDEQCTDRALILDAVEPQVQMDGSGHQGCQCPDQPSSHGCLRSGEVPVASTRYLPL